MNLPALVAHADWSMDPGKRWMALATRAGDGIYVADAPRTVEYPADLVARLLRQGQGGVVAGFDFPIGVPSAYGARAGIGGFLELLPRLGTGEWSTFFQVAERREQISLRRPFYPQRPGNTERSHLLEGLGLEDPQDLLRRCERGGFGGSRASACALFWTLGGNQVGKGAITGWKDMLQPALRTLGERVRLWPFQGRLEDLIEANHVVVTETYPAEFYAHLGVSFPASKAGESSGKRVQKDRRDAGAQMLAWAQQTGIRMTPELRQQILSGFGERGDGEDPFDSVVGLFGMLNILMGNRPTGEPDDAVTRNLEGWILGRDASSSSTQHVSSRPPARQDALVDEPVETSEMDKSSRHSKITGDFAEGLVLYWLSKYGYECARVDHTGIDLIAVHPKTRQRMGVSVKSRSRNPGKEGTYLSIPNDIFEKAKAACTDFGCAPWFAIVVDQGAEIWMFLLTMEHLLFLCLMGKTASGWPMKEQHIARYLADPVIQVVRFQHENIRW